MPELPEVEVVRSGLEPALVGATINAVEVLEPRSLKRHDPVRGSFEALVTGAKPLAVVRRGKFLWLPISDELAIVGHLGMSGQMLIRESGHVETGLLRIRFAIEHPEHGEFDWNFVDQRIFGSLALDALLPVADGGTGGYAGTRSLPGEWQHRIPSQVAHIARDPIDPAFDDEQFVAALRRKQTGIKRALLDQRLVSGIGNIYADEALWAARVHFETPGSALSARKARELLAAVREVLEKALVEGGTSFDAQYVNVNGASGYFSHSLNAYGRHGKACPRCSGMIRREAFMNRGSHFCPKCQRKPRIR